MDSGCCIRQQKIYFMEDNKIKLYQNVFYDQARRLVWYQQYHESLESALKTFIKQSNGDEPAYIIEVIGNVVHKP